MDKFWLFRRVALTQQETPSRGCSALSLHVGRSLTSSALRIYQGVMGDNEEVVEFLLRKGASTTITTDHGKTPLMEASFKGRLGIVRLLVQYTKRRRLDATDGYGYTALHWAAAGGYVEVVAFLMSKGAWARCRDQHGTTPFMVACSKGRVRVVQCFMQRCERRTLRMRDRLCGTALHWAAEGGHTDVVDLLLTSGLWVGARGARHSDDTTPLMVACRRGHLDTAQRLIQHCQRWRGLEDYDQKGRTALYWAISGNQRRWSPSS